MLTLFGIKVFLQTFSQVCFHLKALPQLFLLFLAAASTNGLREDCISILQCASDL